MSRCAVIAMFAGATAAAAAGAGAQTFRDALLAMASQVPDLKLPAEAKEAVPSASSGMAIYKPAGSGPFPALVIVHSCGGIRTEINDAAREALARGYVAFVLDAFGQRGLHQVCIPSRATSGVNFVRGARDALQAVAHLGQFPFVDRQRVGLLGFSWGGTVGLLAGGRSYVEALSPASGPAALVAFYPLCFLPAKATASGRDVEFVRPDHAPPALVLLAGQDNEAPPSECLPRLQSLKEKGIPVDWHLYADATHCWDCASMDGTAKVDLLGNHVVYRYSKNVTTDSIRRSFEHFDAWLKPK